jgi:hypothetical protein
MIFRLSRKTAQLMGEIAADWQVLEKLAPRVLRTPGASDTELMVL